MPRADNATLLDHSLPERPTTMWAGIIHDDKFAFDTRNTKDAIPCGYLADLALIWRFGDAAKWHKLWHQKQILPASWCLILAETDFPHATLENRMVEKIETESDESKKKQESLWCPTCGHAKDDPLVCGDCAAVICRICGTPLESPDELAFG